MSGMNLSGPNLSAEILGLRFIGAWTVSAQQASRLTEVVIMPSRSQGYFELGARALGGKARRPILLKYDPSTDTLVSPGNPRGASTVISFWRNPAVDMIFAVSKNSNGNDTIWTAKRTEAVGSQNSGVLEKIDGRQWQVVMSNGHRAMPLGSFISLRQVEFLDPLSPGNPLPIEGPRLVGLFNDEELYDLVIYNESLGSFTSVFSVRSLRYWPGGDSSPDRLFATFDNSFSVPTSRVDNGMASLSQLRTWAPRLGELLPFEKFGQGIQDPDAGCWCAEPPPG